MDFIDTSNNLYRIRMHFAQSDNGNALHELKHGFQALKGDLTYTLNNNGTVITDYNKSIYTNQAHFEQPSNLRQYAYVGVSTIVVPVKGQVEYLTNQAGNIRGTDQQFNTVITILNTIQSQLI